MDAVERSGLVFEACARGWREDQLTASELGGHRLVLDRQPDLIRDAEDRIAGVDAWVHLYGPDGRELRVDPHRRIVNPPTVHADLGEDPAQAWLQAVWDSVIRVPNRRGWRTAGTVDTFFASTADGSIVSANGTYSTARSGGGTLTAFTAETILYPGQFHSTGAGYECYESFISFDTSSIADTNIVSAVVLDLYLTNDVSTGSDFVVEAREQDWSTSVTTADWIAGASLSGKTLMASISTNGIGGTGAYKTLTSTASFKTATNLKTGVVHLLLCSDRLTAGTTPSSNTSEYVEVSSADVAGTTQDPKLTVTHAAPAGTPFFTSRPPRVWRLN